MAQRTYEDILAEALSGSPTSQEPMSGGNEAARPFTQDYYQNAPSTGNSGVSGYGYGGTTPPPVMNGGGTVTTQPVPVPASGGSPYAGGDRGSAIAGFYRKYLGRAHDADGYNGWVNGNLSLQQIEQAIQSSPEARQYAASQSSGGSTGSTSNSSGPGFNSNRLDDNVINAYIARWADLPGADPSLKTDPAYWAARIKEKGGLGADNESYWQWMALNNYKQTPHSGGGEFNDQWGGQLESLVNQYLGNTKKRAEELATQYRARAKELNQPAYTSADEAAIRARAFDQLERRRAETAKNQREQVYARGFAPTSGLAAGADQEVNRNFEQARGTIESNLTQSAIDETQRRKDAAMQLEALATEALNGGDLSAIQATGLPLQLMDTRQTQALNTYNSSNNNTLSSLLAIIQAASGQQQGQNTQNANTASGLGSLLPLILQYL